MKYEQKVQVETQEYICLVKRIDGVVAQKNLVSELIRCKDCKCWDKPNGWNGWCDKHSILVEADDFCSSAERKEE